MFSGWCGAATGTDNPVTVTMDADKTLTANFVDDDDGGDDGDDQADNCQTQPDGLCTAPKVRIREVELGVTVVTNDSETGLKPLAVAAIPCFGMYMVRFNNAGQEQWATQLTTQSAQLPPYST